ncbi:MAG: alpha/beta hydrolase [Bacteroidales bacterium]|jgi:pimeloyl-ACP methyl ester carboxylesterase|nr:alpha/beta hydrolase [Bacteroidales bacterium]
MKKIIPFLFLLQTLTVFALPCAERVEKAGWTYFSIPDKAYPEVDSIRYIVSKPFNPENPTIFFSQGSGNYAVLEYYDYDDGRSWNYLIIPPFQVTDYVENYNFVVIAKPGTPICKPYTGSPPPLIDTAFGNYPLFTKMNFLDYYVKQLNQVVDIIRKQSNPDAPFFFIGNSQGGEVVTKFVEKHPQKVQRLVIQACGVLDRSFEGVSEYRRLMDIGQISSEEAQKRIDELYLYYDWLKKYSTNFASEYDYNPEKTPYTEEQHYHIMTHATYSFDIILPRLQNIDCPLLFVYGTADIKTRSNDLLPFFFTSWGKNNLTMMPILDANHTFSKMVTDPETGEQKQEYIGQEVFARIVEWFEKKE